tara:strand:+ start:5700 stop:6311 length:612 start_codon:yes stop_codon:yes gene_type:complete
MKTSYVQLIVGLGNPGAKYIDTRHNIGFMVLEELAKIKETTFKNNKKIKGDIAEFQSISGVKRLLMPKTYMNDSGASVKQALNWFGIKADKLLVVVDDLDLPLGRIRLRRDSSAGGHNGLKSIINHLGTQNFYRMKIGIGSPDCINENKKALTISHVLGKFHKVEKPILNEVINEALSGIDILEESGPQDACNQINGFRLNNK